VKNDEIALTSFTIKKQGFSLFNFALHSGVACKKQEHMVSFKLRATFKLNKQGKPIDNYCDRVWAKVLKHQDNGDN